MIRMWFHGGAVITAVMCGALLAVAHLHLDQHVKNDSFVKAAVLKCLMRYVRAADDQGVVLMHNNHAHTTRYVASFGSPLTILNVGLLKKKPGNNMFLLPNTILTLIQRSRSLMVLIVATKKDISDYFEILMHDLYTETQPKYLAVCLEPEYGALTRGFFSMVRKYKLYEVAAMNAKNSNVYWYYPPGVCHFRWFISKLGECQRLSFDQLYVRKVPNNYVNCSASVRLPTSLPHALDNTSHSEQPLVAGYEMALINLILGQLKINSSIIDKYYSEACLFATTYYTGTVRWYVPVAGPRAQWKSVVQVFQAPLWFTILAFFMLNAFVWWLIGGGGFASYVQCVLGSLVTLLNGSVPLPRRTPHRFIVVSWTLCALVLSAAYQSQLLSTLLTPVAGDQPITNEQQLLASDMPVDLSLVGPEIKKMRSYKQIMAHAQKFGVNGNKSHAILQYALTAKYRAREQSDARGKPTLYAFEEPAGYVPLCVKLGMFSVLIGSVNRMVQRLMENGIVAKFMREVDFSGYVATGGPEDEPLTMRHLDFAFVALLMGCALATLALLLETVVWRTQHGWWRILCNAARGCGTSIQNCWCAGTTRIRIWRRRARFLRRRRAFRARLRAQMNQ